MEISLFIVYTLVTVSFFYIIYYVSNRLRKGETDPKCSRCMKLILKNSKIKLN
jgi:uncharacterized membrane protein